MENDFDIVKWWGAIVATIALAWNIISYKLNVAKVVIRLTNPICFLDGKVISTKVQKGVSSTELASYCLIEIINRGKAPTTISKIIATGISKDKLEIICDERNFQLHNDVKLPKTLGVGEMVTCRLESCYINRLKQHGTTYIKVYPSHSNKPTKKKVL
ncbi:hypothetical protein [Pseudocolwellia agarivorans]|uniref:hypothetical protein n=1 Tax=Pseudocolwellia agarivorans TaxID=1911682 RepID=UPI003F8841AD